MTSPLSAAFQRARQAGRLALIGYLPAAYPTPQAFLQLAQAAFAAGLDILEIGLPAPHPHLDGEVIRAALQQVEAQGLTPQAALDLASQALVEPHTCGVAMFYPDTLAQLGPHPFFPLCRQAGFSGLLPVGLPFAGWQALAPAARLSALDLIGFITHDMHPPAIRQLAQDANGFLYLQSQNGPTGQQGEFGDEVHSRLLQVKIAAAAHPLPVAVGFGVRHPADVERIRALPADGVIVGTAMVEAAALGPAALQELISGLSQAAYFQTDPSPLPGA